MAKKLLWLTLFGIAFACVESVVVVYLREIHYPAGFGFPLILLPPSTVLIEYIREAATLLMLTAVAVVAARTREEFGAFFLFNFGVWDIFYYVWLKIFLGWPSSLLTWDLLFLIPVPWVSPVLAPVLTSLLFIAVSLVLLYYHTHGHRFWPTWPEWGIIFLSASTILTSFLIDLKKIKAYQHPGPYPWFLFGIGFLLGILVFIKFLMRTVFSKKTA
jgi:hypothetical protein